MSPRLLLLLPFLAACSFTTEALPLPPSFYGLETRVDDSQREEAWLGMEVDLNQTADVFSLDVQPGVRVTAVEEDGPAADGGIAVGDILLRYDGQAVDDPQRLDSLLAAEPEARDVALEFQRGSEVLATTAGLEMRSTSRARRLYWVERGLLRAAFTDDERGRPVVHRLEEGSPLDWAGVVVGETVLELDGVDAGSSAELVRRVRLGLQPGQDFVLLVRGLDGRNREVEARTWSPRRVWTEFGLWPLFKWSRVPGEDRGEFWVGDLILIDLFHYTRDGGERRWSVLSLLQWQSGELVLEEQPTAVEDGS